MSSFLKKLCPLVRINWCLCVRLWKLRLSRGNKNDVLTNVKIKQC